MLETMIRKCSDTILLALAKAALIPQLINTLNPLSISFTEAVNIHTCLVTSIMLSVWLASPDGLRLLQMKDGNEQQSVRKTVLTQVLAPSEKNIQEPVTEHLTAPSLSTLNHLPPLVLVSPDFNTTLSLSRSVVFYLEAWRIGVGTHTPAPSAFMQRCDSSLAKNPFEYILLFALDHLKMLPSHSLSSSRDTSTCANSRLFSIPAPSPHTPPTLLWLSLTTHTLPLSSGSPLTTFGVARTESRSFEANTHPHPRFLFWIDSVPIPYLSTNCPSPHFLPGSQCRSGSEKKDIDTPARATPSLALRPSHPPPQSTRPTSALQRQLPHSTQGSVGVLLLSPPSLPIINIFYNFWGSTRSSVPSPQFPISRDCSAFLNWDENEEELESIPERAVVFRSLVATVKIQHVLNDYLEAKAKKLLESVDHDVEESADDFLNSFASSSDDSLTEFVQCILVLLSSPSQVIITAAMQMIRTLLTWCSADNLLALVRTDLVYQLINTLNPLSLSFAEAEDIHICLMKSIWTSLWLATPFSLRKLEIEDGDGQHAVRETIFKQVLAPSEQFICHFCTNRFSIVDGDQSETFLGLLAQILHISPYHQPTMDFVLQMPVFLTLPSCLTFFKNDESIYWFLGAMINSQQDWNKKRGEERQMWKTVHRMLRMEGFEDVIEAKLQNDKTGSHGGSVVTKSGYTAPCWYQL
ncbi:hypothetical protein BLNAU_22165 [Blattamonas nauphoetae]|uniref:Uncharacterized protein n=1 Tax=Blattamonas nauphoetae TaxID=2049346 RepID=A0ABQ9WTR8_9EUKA|nr:hypothetical protein BLNAU_22165 [Blattamonas nauphoetae]